MPGPTLVHKKLNISSHTFSFSSFQILISNKTSKLQAHEAVLFDVEAVKVTWNAVARPIVYLETENFLKRMLLTFTESSSMFHETGLFYTTPLIKWII